MAKSTVALSNEEVIKQILAIGEEYPSTDIAQGSPPSYLKILNSDKQVKFFTDGDNLAMKDYGKLFIANKGKEMFVADLRNEIELTLLRVQRGHFIYPELGNGRPDKSKLPVGSCVGFINKTEADTWKDAHKGYAYVNAMRLVLVESSGKEATELLMSGGNPFVIMDLKGASMEGWFSVSQKMNEAFAQNENYPPMPINKRINPIFKLVVSSRKVKFTADSGKDIETFVPVFEVKTNDPDVVNDYVPLYTEYATKDLFGTWGVDTSNEDDLDKKFEDIGKDEDNNDEVVDLMF